MTPAVSGYAVRQAWVGFWHGCMRGVGGSSVLPFDPDAVEGLLNGHDVPEAEPIEPVPWPKPEPTPEPELSALAQQLEGNEQISDITLADVIEGLDDYFKTFRRVKKINHHAYDYFSRVGVPLTLKNTKIWRSILDDVKPVVDPANLPAFLGLYNTKTPEMKRKEIFNTGTEDEGSLPDLHLYEKRRRNVAVPSAWKYTIYDDQEFYLERDDVLLTNAERNKFPWYKSFGFHYFIGVEPNGYVRALPMRMERFQTLRCGRTIVHNEFKVPPGLVDLCKECGVDKGVALFFAATRAFAASATLGVQLSIRRNREVARFGIPLSYAKSFFRDRDSGGKRRSPLLHYIGTYEYTRANGRVVTVGEHLRGVRHFTWRGYSIMLSAPGIHHPAPEALTAEVLSDDDLLPLPEKTVTMTALAKAVQRTISNPHKVPFRKGKPTISYRTAHMSVPPPLPDELAEC